MDLVPKLLRPYFGVTVSLLLFFFLSVAIIPIRSSISVATPALILIVPVVVGVSLGGFLVGAIDVIVGFLIYDFVFIPPYYTLSVGASQNWVALGVYATVMLIVSKVVSDLQTAKRKADQARGETRRLMEFSQELIGQRSPLTVANTTANALFEVFNFDSITISVPESKGTFKTMVHVGEEIDGNVAASITPQKSVELVSQLRVTSPKDANKVIMGLPLSSGGTLVGFLVVSGSELTKVQKNLLQVFIDQCAISLHKAILDQEAEKSRVLEEVDRWRKTLLETVSHDLRTPLSSIKTAASVLIDSELKLQDQDFKTLVQTVLSQTDRLTQMVFNLLDATKIESGNLVLRLSNSDLFEAIVEGVRTLGDEATGRVEFIGQDNFSQDVNIDISLIGRVSANLVENALRYSPKNRPVEVRLIEEVDCFRVKITDYGPPIPSDIMSDIVEMLQGTERSRRSQGLGLWIAKTFIELHGGAVGVDSMSESGVTFYFTVPKTIPSTLKDHYEHYPS